MDFLWIIQRIRKIKVLSQQMSTDSKYQSKYLLINDSDSEIE